MRRLARNIARNFAQAEGVHNVNRQMKTHWRRYLQEAIREYGYRELLRKRQAETLAGRS